MTNTKKMKTATKSLEDRLRADPAFRREWERTALGRAVALRLVEYRADNELSQTALARKLGMHQPAIARLEAGDHNPSMETLMHLARVLEIDFRIDITSDHIAVELSA